MEIHANRLALLPSIKAQDGKQQSAATPAIRRPGWAIRPHLRS